MDKADRGSGQTSLDFLTGMSIFALTIVFVLQFTGGSLVSVGSTTTEKGALADRSAALLVENNWSAGEPGIINETETEEYFRSGTPPIDYNAIKTGLAIPERYGINISVYDKDGDIMQVGGTDLRTGGEGYVADVASVGSKKRVVYMQGPNTNHTVVVEVKVW